MSRRTVRAARRVLLALALVAIFSLAAADRAAANSMAYRAVTDSCSCTLKGVRSTALTPNSQEAIILAHDWEVTSVQANDGFAQNLLQAGWRGAIPISTASNAQATDTGTLTSTENIGTSPISGVGASVTETHAK